MLFTIIFIISSVSLLSQARCAHSSSMLLTHRIPSFVTTSSIHYILRTAIYIAQYPVLAPFLFCTDFSFSLLFSLHDSLMILPIFRTAFPCHAPTLHIRSSLFAIPATAPLYSIYDVIPSRTAFIPITILHAILCLSPDRTALFYLHKVLLNPAPHYMPLLYAM